MHNTSLLVVLLLCSFVCLNATQIFVNTTTITQALANATNGDEFVLSNGTYPNLNFTLYGMSVSFVSASGDPKDVIIDGEGSNIVSPLMLFYSPTITSLPANLSTSLSVSGITFKNCGTVEPDFSVAEYMIGGAIAGDSNLTLSVDVNISNCVFEGGFAGFGGQIFFEEVDGPINILISNTTFSDNEAFFGGAIYASGLQTTVTITSSSFVSLNTYVSGGIFIDGVTLTLNDSTVTDSRAGLAHYIAEDKILGGAALYMEIGSTAYINNLWCENNKGNGAGAIFSRGHLTILRSTFHENSAQRAAGAVGVLEGQITIKGCSFVQDAADDGDGGALNLEFTTGFISSSSFDSCIAANWGGAVVVQFSDITLDNCTFTDNTAFAGGAILTENGTTLVTNSQFTKNSAIGGGGIYAAGPVIVVNTSITGNIATEDGGGVYVDLGASFTLQESTITGSKANRGASLFCGGGSINLIDSTVNATSGADASDVNANGLFCDPSHKITACAVTATNTAGDWANLCSFEPTPPPSGPKKSNKIKPWAIALIVILVVAATVAIAGLIVYIFKRKKSASPTSFSKM